MIRVDQLMTLPVLTCRASQSLEAAAALMWDHDCGAVPVVDDAGRLVGMITDRDACMGAYTQGKRLGEIPIESVMSRRVVACRADDPVGFAEELMQTHQVRRIPVIDADDRPIGLLSLNDLARGALRPGPGQRAALLTFARTLATICRPHGAKPEVSSVPQGWEDYVQKDVVTDAHAPQRSNAET